MTQRMNNHHQSLNKATAYERVRYGPLDGKHRGTVPNDAQPAFGPWASGTKWHMIQ